MLLFAVVPQAPHALTFRLLRMSVHVYTLQLCAATASVILRGLKAPPTRVTLNWRMHLDSVSAGQPMLSDDQLRAIQVVYRPLSPRDLHVLLCSRVVHHHPCTPTSGDVLSCACLWGFLQMACENELSVMTGGPGRLPTRDGSDFFWCYDVVGLVIAHPDVFSVCFALCRHWEDVRAAGDRSDLAAPGPQSAARRPHSEGSAPH